MKPIEKMTIEELGQEKAPLFCISMCASYNHEDGRIMLSKAIKILVARSEDEANGLAMRLCHTAFPEEKGYRYHTWMVKLVSQEYIDYCKMYL